MEREYVTGAVNRNEKEVIRTEKEIEYKFSVDNKIMVECFKEAITNLLEVVEMDGLPLHTDSLTNSRVTINVDCESQGKHFMTITQDDDILNFLICPQEGTKWDLRLYQFWEHANEDWK